MNMKSIHQNLLRRAETLGSRNYATLRRVMFTVAMAAGVCGAAWSQGTTTVSQGTTTVSQGTTTVVQAGQNVTKIAGGAVSGGATVQVASGTTVSIEGAAPAAGKVARLKLTRKAENTENGQSENGQSGESGISLSQNASLESTDDNDETRQLKHNIEEKASNDFNYLPDDIRDQLPDNASITDIYTLTLDNYSTGDLTATIKFDTPFAASADVWIVFAYPIDDGDASWFIVQGTAVDDGSVQTTIPANTLAQLANKKLIAFAFDKK